MNKHFWIALTIWEAFGIYILKDPYYIKVLIITNFFMYRVEAKGLQHDPMVHHVIDCCIPILAMIFVLSIMHF